MIAPTLTLPRKRGRGSVPAILRDLGANARGEIERAARQRELCGGEMLYREGAPGESLFAVVAGEIELRAVRRGDAEESRLRLAGAGESVGEEVTLPGVSRRATAVAGAGGARVLEIPLAVFRRVTARAGSAAADRERRYLERAALRDLLGASALGRELDEAELGPLLDAVSLERFARGERLFETGDPARDLFVVLDGMIQLQHDDEGRTSVKAYLARGDVFGDDEALSCEARAAAAVATGDTYCARLPARSVRRLASRRPEVFDRLARVRARRAVEHEAKIAGAAAHTTRHVFRDLYRMQVARSLLVIDQESCVRCGHCAWSCAQVHGESRLTRRGDQVVAKVPLLDQSRAATLLLPQSCQHCRHAACMIDCPTGAIGRDLEGEVFIRPELCTGCGACVKACPWDNIRLAARGTGAAPRLSPEVAVKCDLCRDLAAPSCVESCPTGSILRLDPARDFAEVGALLGYSEPLAPRSGSADGSTGAGDASGWSAALRPLFWGAAAAGSLALGTLGFTLQRAGHLVPGRGFGLAAGVVTGMLVAALALYVVPKRMAARRARRGVRGKKEALPRSRVRPHLLAHVAFGFAALAGACAHTGLAAPPTPAGALQIAFFASALLGLLGAVLYVLLPPSLSRLERRGALPEDLAGERDRLLDRLYREASGASRLVKAIAERVIIPYARAAFGPLRLLAGGRSLAAERRRVRARIDRIVAQISRDRDLSGLDNLIDVAVELRALPARRGLTLALRAWLPLHLVTGALALALLVVHVAGVMR